MKVLRPFIKTRITYDGRIVWDFWAIATNNLTNKKAPRIWGVYRTYQQARKHLRNYVDYVNDSYVNVEWLD